MGLVETIRIDKTPSEHTFNINPEKAFFRFIDIIPSKMPLGMALENESMIDITIGYEIKGISRQTESSPSIVSTYIRFSNRTQKAEALSETIPLNPNYKTLTLNVTSDKHGRQVFDHSTSLLHLILISLLEVGEISERDLFKLYKLNYFDYFKASKSIQSQINDEHISHYCALNVIGYIGKVIDLDVLYKKLIKTSENISAKISSEQENIFGHSLLPLINGTLSNGSTHPVYYSGKNFQVSVEQEPNHELRSSYYTPIKVLPVSGDTREISTKTAFIAFANCVLEYKKITQ